MLSSRVLRAEHVYHFSNVLEKTLTTQHLANVGSSSRWQDKFLTLPRMSC
jgi:hypothetical protein